MSAPRPAPLVSVIIPTRRRPELLVRAIRSVAAQTMGDLEVIVVIDGPDPATAAALTTIGEPRLSVIELPSSLGPGQARNMAAETARGHWIAFLDDDDEWKPEKLTHQLVAAGDRDVLVTCKVEAVTPAARYIWPRRVYDGSQTVDDYLFDRRSLFHGEGMINTSTFLLPLALFLRTRFGDSRQMEDHMLVLRVTKLERASVVMVPEALVTVYKEEDRESLGSNFDWREMLGWAKATRPLLTDRAYAGFCLVYLGSQAAQQRDSAAVSILLREALRNGGPSAFQLGLFVGFWAVPMTLRRRLRSALTAQRRPV